MKARSGLALALAAVVAGALGLRPSPSVVAAGTASQGGDGDQGLAAAWPHYAMAAVTAGLPLLLAGYLVVPGCAAAAAAQVAISASTPRIPAST
jgi:hypothetical protein